MTGWTPADFARDAGEVHTREVEVSTGYANTEPCWTCGGEGQVAA